MLCPWRRGFRWLSWALAMLGTPWFVYGKEGDLKHGVTLFPTDHVGGAFPR
jgi:hypothetical protein